MEMTFQMVYDRINACAPFDTQADFDNSGFLLGNPGEKVRGIQVALDVTDRVLDEAEKLQANLIVTHHPMMFSPVQRLREDDYEGRLIARMIRNRMGLICAHTNLDAAKGGINDVLAGICGLENVTGEMYLRVGTLPGAPRFSELVPEIEKRLNTVIRIMGQLPGDTRISRMGVSSGAGSEFFRQAREAGAQVFLSGEIRHHHALEMAGLGMAGLEAGHFATEEPGIFALADALQSYADLVECRVRISKTSTGAYALPSVF